MTSDEINREIASLCGWRIDVLGDWVDVNHSNYNEAGDPPDYCGDPSTWVDLFMNLPPKQRSAWLAEMIENQAKSTPDGAQMRTVDDQTNE